MVAMVEPRRPFIDGKYVPGDGPALAVENPATEETIAEVETASTEQETAALLRVVHCIFNLGCD